MQSEIATSEDRGKLSGLLQFMLSWGFFIAQWLGYGCFQVNSDFQCKSSYLQVDTISHLTIGEQGAFHLHSR